MLDWEWYDHPTVGRIFIHCLLKANHEEKKWRGKTILPGQLITSASKLGKELGLSRQQIRTGLATIQSTSELTIETTNNYTLITITNWETHQQTNQPDNHPHNHQITTNKNNKNNNKDKNNIYAPLFESFWNAYPLKKSKKKASQLFFQAVKSGVAAEKIIQAATDYANLPGRQQAYTKHPTTWLRGGCWDDEHVPTATTNYHQLI